ncbi:DUF5330 domain-containing protein [Chthonobacter rhizosphaerae]|uniref:DUF5330 domain-containing protein n=1 Tax=Chthonobacter rhizosphaerae TaxID=2735553 RepID=UPI0015EF0F3D|nr:DUF5330 domain-containing protein [Chthonobacter rhizosphaerae]
MFLIRTAFWLTIAILLIPVDEETARQVEESGLRPIAAGEAIIIAEDALVDAGGFCDRNPTTCEIGSRFGATLAVKAKAGARLLSDFLDEQFAAEPAPGADRGTLTAEDLQAPWRGPALDTSI